MFIKLLVVTSVYVTAGVEAKGADTFFQKTKSQGTLVQRTHYQKSKSKRADSGSQVRRSGNLDPGKLWALCFIRH